MNIAAKGSQFHIQSYVNDYSDSLNQAIFSHSPSLLAYTEGQQDITWKSPLAVEDYKEYQDDFFKLYYDDNVAIKQAIQDMRLYWPKKGPVWDGAGVVKGTAENGLLLVEAKSHLQETKSKIMASSEQSKDRIKKTITETKTQFCSAAPITPWQEQYYQLANRLAYLYILNQKLQIPTWLILVNFVDDETLGQTKKTSRKQWLAHYQQVFQTLGISHQAPLLSRLVILYLPAIKMIGLQEGVPQPAELTE